MSSKRKSLKSEDKKVEEYLIKKHERIIERLMRDTNITKDSINDIRKKYMDNIKIDVEQKYIRKNT